MKSLLLIAACFVLGVVLASMVGCKAPQNTFILQTSVPVSRSVDLNFEYRTKF